MAESSEPGDIYIMPIIIPLVWGSKVNSKRPREGEGLLSRLLMAACLVALVAVFSFHTVASLHSLEFPDAYYAKGTIYLPYGDITEPFEAWVDMNSGDSRLDTYNGTNLSGIAK